MLAWDGSENAAAYFVATDLARRYSAELTAVSVAPVPQHSELPGEKERALTEARTSYTRKLEALIGEAETAKTQLRHKVVAGDHPAQALLECARNQAFDLIVIGRWGLGRTSWFRNLGSVTDRVARSAPCPVMVVGRGE